MYTLLMPSAYGILTVRKLNCHLYWCLSQEQSKIPITWWSNLLPGPVLWMRKERGRQSRRGYILRWGIGSNASLPPPWPEPTSFPRFSIQFFPLPAFTHPRTPLYHSAADVLLTTPRAPLISAEVPDQPALVPLSSWLPPSAWLNFCMQNQHCPQVGSDYKWSDYKPIYKQTNHL